MQTPANPLPLPPVAGSARLRRLQQRVDAHLEGGQLAAAIGALETLLQQQPDHVPSLLKLAELHLQEERHNHARALTMRALQGHLESPRVALQLIRMLAALSESGLMVEVARQMPPPIWDSSKSLAELSQELSLIGAHELAMQYAKAGIERDQQHPPSLYMHATLDVFYGDMTSAAAHAERCLAMVPDDPGSHWLLSRLRLPDPEARIARIEHELARDISRDSEAWLAYALHNELHDLRDFERSWQALERGCRAKRATLGYTQAHSDAVFEALRGWSAEEIARGDGHAAAATRPVFVIGLHRSGTTLAERILSGHSQVTAGGETYDIRSQLRRATGLHFGDEVDLRVVNGRERLDYRAIGEGYLRSMAWRNRGTPLITDKLPSNYFNVGFIARALPQARFIHLNRDPVDVGLSSLRTLFSHACPYSYDQQEYIAHYRNYRRLMDHWRALLPDRLLDVNYDDLVGAPEATATAMARFCGLDFEPGMLRIESRDDAVATASSVMMRDGIRRDRGKVWKAYESQLAPMIQAFAAG